MPKVREGSYCPDWLLTHRRHAERALATGVATAYLLGFSTRRVARLAEQLGVKACRVRRSARWSRTLLARPLRFASARWMPAPTPRVGRRADGQGPRRRPGVNVHAPEFCGRVGCARWRVINQLHHNGVRRPGVPGRRSGRMGRSLKRGARCTRLDRRRRWRAFGAQLGDQRPGQVPVSHHAC